MVDIKKTSGTTISSSAASSRAPTAAALGGANAQHVAEMAASEDAIQAAQDALFKQNKMLQQLHQRMAPSAYYSAQNMFESEKK